MALARNLLRDPAWRLAVLWGIVAFTVHTVGNEAGWYFQYGWYQNLTHAWSASALTTIVVVAGTKRGLRGSDLLAFTLGLVAVGAFTWEAVEYVGLLDPFGIPLHFHNFHDMAIDMVSNAVGVSTTIATLWFTMGLGSGTRSTTHSTRSPNNPIRRRYDAIRRRYDSDR